MSYGSLPELRRRRPRSYLPGEPSLETPMYIDPAAGSLILQVIIAGILAVTTTVKSARDAVIRVIRGLFGSRKQK
jgi:hypothetical protein